MCNLYSMTRARAAVLRLFKVSDNRAEQFDCLPAIFPGYKAPVVRKADDGVRELSLMNWGFLLLQPGRAPKRVTNTRDDKVQTSFWRPSIEQRRCLVPVSSYCEPNGQSPCTWHWFAINGEHERPLFAFPGIWRSYKGPIKKDGPNVEQNVFSFMTTLPNALTASINHERMPVLLAAEAEHEQWLSGTPAEALNLIRSFDAAQMRIVQKGIEKEDLLAA